MKNLKTLEALSDESHRFRDPRKFNRDKAHNKETCEIWSEGEAAEKLGLDDEIRAVGERLDYQVSRATELRSENAMRALVGSKK